MAPEGRHIMALLQRRSSRREKDMPHDEDDHYDVGVDSGSVLKTPLRPNWPEAAYLGF